ncbi:phospholipid/cholesterol/gamma-HCH transport system substrate-binding protein [Thermomonospora echinospora]|uniref:Phospholipid/cholesterol/gamma-HCH transport system substrate-binding protein n=1 Tax=Thermomonospora echinospora TaxID=1992 RepID=A0A1H5Y1B6_9ACTN|nr:MCE family protein [Thermomonospora echinospora]SEG17733.1 phospholipid/cholesterol/gamma-HCH transport system substrate-binding protein [Thermomonospora echinospora]
MRRKSIAGPLAKSIAFIVVTVVATAALAISIANTGVGDTVAYKARFTDTTGLIIGDSVRIAGVRVGQVEGIRVVDRRLAEVTFNVERDRRLPATTTATIKYLNMVGQRFVELGRGEGQATGQAATLRPGDTIPEQRTTPALDLTQLFDGFQPLFQALSPNDINKLAGELISVFQGEGATVQSLVSTVGSLTSTLAAKDKVIGQVIDNLTTVVETVNAREGQFVTLVSTLRQLVQGFAADRRVFGEAIVSLSDLADTTSSLLRDSRDPLREDIKQLGRLSENLADSTPALETFLRRLPVKMQTIGRVASYGSWLNFYLCEATVRGVSWEHTGGEDHGPPPTGIPVTEQRCKG